MALHLSERLCLWLAPQIEVLMPKYLEEAAGAAEYVVISSPLMTTHLKNSLLQVIQSLWLQRS